MEFEYITDIPKRVVKGPDSVSVHKSYIIKMEIVGESSPTDKITGDETDFTVEEKLDVEKYYSGTEKPKRYQNVEDLFKDLEE